MANVMRLFQRWVHYLVVPAVSSMLITICAPLHLSSVAQEVQWAPQQSAMNAQITLQASSPTLVAQAPATQFDCAQAKITQPKGAREQQDAKAYPVKKDIQIKWNLADCVMTVEYYQRNEPKKKYKGVRSGDTLNIGTDGSGETELKLWREGKGEPSHSVWVWVQ